MPWNNIHNESHQSIKEILNKQSFYYSVCSGPWEPLTWAIHSMNEGFQAGGVPWCI